MRPKDHTQDDLFCARTLEQLVPADHRLRQLRPLVDEAMQQIRPRLTKLYSHTGRPSIAPERLLRASLLQVLYGVRSERRLMEELSCHMAWRWFVGLSLNEDTWNVTVFTKNRERFLRGDIAQQWLAAVVKMLQQRRLIDEEHFSVDATLIGANAGEQSYQPKQNPPATGAGSGRRGELLKRDTHESKTDRDAQLYRKSKRARVSVGLPRSPGDGKSTRADRGGNGQQGEARENGGVRAGCWSGWGGACGSTRWALTGLYNERDFVEPLRDRGITAHVPAYRAKRRDWMESGLRSKAVYRNSQRVRKRIESCFGWLKEMGGQRRTPAAGRGESELGIHLRQRGVEFGATSETAPCGLRGSRGAQN